MCVQEPLPLLSPAMVAAGGLAVRLSAECVVDRVRMAAEWVQQGEGDSSSSSSSGEDE